MGLGGLVLAMHVQNFLNMLLFSSSFYMPIVTVPMVLAILGFRSQPPPVLIGMAAGLMMVIVWSIYGKNADSVIPGMLTNLLFFMGSHYLLKAKGGWVSVKVSV
jgi:hypothetical protein